MKLIVIRMIIGVIGAAFILVVLMKDMYGILSILLLLLGLTLIIIAYALGLILKYFGKQ